MKAHHLTAALLVSLVAAAPAAADQKDVFTFADPFNGSAQCDGFVDNWEGHDHGTVMNFWHDGVLYRQVGQVHAIETDVNSVTGKAVVVRTNFTVTGDLSPDGELTTWKLSGELNIGNFPGEGIVIHDAGSVDYTEGIPTAVHGIHDVLATNGDVFCQALS